ncbi:MAG: M81 family metallopeptidase [Clostridiaceae bacterium]|nr:M81 family metallopeptidase [Clostridiaceae bacterium]
MRIGIGGIAHETNAFSPVSTKLESFERREYAEGQAIIDKHTGVRSYIGGMIAEAGERGADPIAILYANAVPSGKIAKSALETLRDRLIDGLLAAHRTAPLDGIVLALHGAGAAEGYPDIEGEILRAVREVFGPVLPIGVVLDLHGNISEEMAEYADVLIGVKGYPHVDMFEAGRTAFGLICDMVETGSRPYMRLVRLPFLFAPGKGLTIEGPACDIRQRLLRAEQGDEDLIYGTFFHGFPFADVPIAGASVVTVARTREAADRYAGEISEYVWNRRADFDCRVIMPAEAMDKAMQYAEGPVIINESSDNSGGGSPNDATWLLREMLERNLPATAFSHICDPEVVRQAVQAGVGGRISCLLGGKTDRLHGDPIRLEDAYVKTISDGRAVCLSPMGKGSMMDIGLTVRLQIGNVDVVVSTQRAQEMDKRPFEIVGIDVTELRIIGLKSTHHFRAWWKDHSVAIVPCDPPGVHCSDLSQFQFMYIDKTYYPFNKEREWHFEV